MVDVAARQPIAIYLSPTSQTQFLETLGFVYNFDFAKKGDEPSPRTVTADSEYNVNKSLDDASYILAVRSDEQAGGGGLLGLPSGLSRSRATVIPLDDPAIVAAIRTWTPNSEKMLLDKLVPVLHNRVK